MVSEAAVAACEKCIVPRTPAMQCLPAVRAALAGMACR